MYRVSVPLMGRSVWKDREETVSRLKQIQADRVFLVSQRNLTDSTAQKHDIAELKRAISYYKGKGFEVGVWLGETIGHGGTLAGSVSPCDGDLELWTDAEGHTHSGNYCPLGEHFVAALCDWVYAVAQLAPDLIMLDDDLRASGRGHSAPGCYCDVHLAEFAARYGEALSRDEIRKQAYRGAPNRCRAVFMQVQGEALRRLAQRVRRIVDTVNPAIRVGHCAVYSTLGPDGVDSLELSRLFAGHTNPFFRQIGAPYWADRKPETMARGIELQRLQNSLAHGDEAERMAEGDTYPRPRTACSAAFLENYDLIMRADGTPGILKYIMDYVASPQYETGYLTAHTAHQVLYETVERLFAPGRAVGVRIAFCCDWFVRQVFPDEGVDEWHCTTQLPPPGALFTVAAGLPTTYDAEEGPTVAFDEAVCAVTPAQRRQGLFLNLPAARYLAERGVDVGFTACEPAGVPSQEYFLEEQDNETQFNAEEVFALTLSPGARPVTEFIVNGRQIPGLYEYENKQGERFLVAPFIRGEGTLSQSYGRHRQLEKSMAWLNGRPLPATCTGHPHLYTLVKETVETLTVGLWNFSPDPVYDPVVTLGKNGTRIIETVACQAELDGRRLCLTDIPAGGFAAVQLKKGDIR